MVYLQSSHGWCHMKLLPFRRKFCVHHTTMHHVNPEILRPVNPKMTRGRILSSRKSMRSYIYTPAHCRCKVNEGTFHTPCIRVTCIHLEEKESPRRGSGLEHGTARDQKSHELRVGTHTRTHARTQGQKKGGRGSVSTSQNDKREVILPSVRVRP